MSRKELVEKINSLKLIQKDYWEDIEFPENIEAILAKCKTVTEYLYPHEHRWYETSIVVYELDGEYFGIRYVTKLYSEPGSIEDIFFTIRASLMKPKQIISYEEETII
jgi:hypothetical protein